MLEYKEENILKLGFYNELSEIECSKGWYFLLEEINLKIKQIEQEYDIKDKIKASQVKQKFGELRIYYRLKDVDEFQKADEIQIKISKIVHEAEIASRTICENCGSHGEIVNKSSILMARCTSCLT